MRKLLIPAVAVGVALALGLAGCGSSAAPEGNGADATIDIGSLYEPQNLDNTGGGGQGVTEALNGNVYESLFKLTDTGTVENLLATGYTASADGLTYTITLRGGVQFHSGKTLTAADVKYSLEKVIAPDSKSARKSSFGPIDTIAATDDQTLVVTLKTRSISFIYNLSYVWILNRGNTDPATTADGTGPYKLDSWQRGSTLSLVRFDGYWGTAAKSREVVFHYFTDASALNNAMLTNQIDIITAEQSPDALSQFTGGSAYTINDGASTTKLLLAFNDRVAPFNNVDVRKAVYSAIDRRKLLSSIWGDYGQLIGSMVPPKDPWYEDLSDANPYDVDRARQLLAGAGYPDGFTFTLDTPNYDPHPTVATFLKSELAKIGVTVNVNVITADEWYTKVFQQHDFAATLQEHVNDRDVVWYGNPNFYWGYDNPQVTQWVNQAEQASTTDEQTALLKKVNEQIAADAASVWLYLYPQIVVASSDVSGYPVNGLNSQFYVYDIAKNAR